MIITFDAWFQRAFLPPTFVAPRTSSKWSVRAVRVLFFVFYSFSEVGIIFRGQNGFEQKQLGLLTWRKTGSFKPAIRRVHRNDENTEINSYNEAQRMIFKKIGKIKERSNK